MKLIQFFALCICISFIACGCARESSTTNESPRIAYDTRTDDAERVSLAQLHAETPIAFQATWTSASGRMKIDIDATVEIPETDSIFQIDVTPRAFTEAEAIAVLRAFEPECSGAVTEYVNRESQYNMSITGNEWIVRAGYTLEDNVILFMLMRTERIGSAYHMGGQMQLQNQRTANHCGLSLEEARELADAAALKIAPNFAYAGWGLSELYPNDGSDLRAGEDGYEYIEGYLFCYTPVVEGIQQVYTQQDSQLSDKAMFYPYLNNRLYVAVMDNGLYHVHWTGAEEYGTKTSCALLPFEQIISIAKEILPLKNASLERYYGDAAAIWVDSVILSYCRVQKRDAPGEYMLIPVWDFFGETGTIRSGKKWSSAATVVAKSLLTINAIDGTIIDREYGY